MHDTGHVALVLQMRHIEDAYRRSVTKTIKGTVSGHQQTTTMKKSFWSGFKVKA